MSDDFLSAGYTIDVLATMVGMSPRNIRAHQARKLLAPPVRRGRAAVYHDSHVRRLESIKSLQRQGFNLVSIEAILGVGGADPEREAITALLRRLLDEQPALIYPLTRHGVVRHGEDGSIRGARPRVLRSLIELQRAGCRPADSVRLLGEVLDRMREIADDLVPRTSARALSMTADPARARATSWEEVDQEAVALSQALTVLLTEAFRAALDNHGQASIIDLITRSADADLRMEYSATVDNG